MARKITGPKVELETSGGKGFDPVPPGEYDAFVYEIGVREFGPNSKNPGLEYYNVQFSIDGPTHNNRRVFSRIALTPTWSSGADNFLFFQFFAALRGMTQLELRKEFNENGGIEIPEPNEIEGRLVGLKIVVKPNTYNGVTKDQNEVAAIFVPKEEKALPKITDTVVELEL